MDLANDAGSSRLICSSFATTTASLAARLLVFFVFAVPTSCWLEVVFVATLVVFPSGIGKPYAAVFGRWIVPANPDSSLSVPEWSGST